MHPENFKYYELNSSFLKTIEKAANFHSFDVK